MLNAQKHLFGLILPLTVAISIKNNITILTKSMKKLVKCLAP